MDAIDKKALDSLIKENSLKESADTVELIRDLDFFLEHKKLRREDQWQS